MKFRLTITLMLLSAVLLTGVPAAAQDTARIRFVNLRVDSSALDITDQNGTSLANLGPFGEATAFMDVDTSITGLGFSIITGSGFSASMTAGFGPIFSAGHDYLVLMIGDSEEDTSLTIDLTAEFGGADAVVDDGMGRLLVIYFVRELGSAAFTLSNADHTPIGTTFLSLDASSFSPEARVYSVALLPGDYFLSATAANNVDAALMPEQSLSLIADDITIVAVMGAYPDAVQALLIGPDGATVLGE
jgi:hypothetical protein